MSAILLFFFLATGLFGTSCTKKQNPSNVLRVIIEHDPKTLDWNQYNSIDGIKELLVEPLITYDVNQNPPRLAPALATAWSSNKRGDQWTLKLRQGVQWSDGLPLKPEHVVASVRRFLQPQTRAFLASILYPIRGARALHSGQGKKEPLGVRIDEGNIVFELTRPIAHFPHLLTLYQLSPIREDLMQKWPNGDWLKPPNFTTVGPYLLKEHQPDQSITLIANPKYWNGPRSIATIKALIVNDPTTALSLFDTGGADLLFTVPSQDVPRLKKRNEFHIQKGVSPGILVFAPKYWSQSTRPLRKAVAQVLNREDIAKAHGMVSAEKGWLAQSYGVLNPNMRDSKTSPSSTPSLTTDFSAATPELKLQTTTSPNIKKAAENIQHQLKTKLGLKLTLEPQELRVLAQKVKSNQAAFYLYVMGPDYFDPHSLMEFFTSNSSQNILKWKNKKYDRLISRAESTMQQKERWALYQQAHQLLMDDYYAIPLFAYSYPHLISARLGGFKMPPFYRIELRNLFFKDIRK